MSSFCLLRRVSFCLLLIVAASSLVFGQGSAVARWALDEGQGQAVFEAAGAEGMLVGDAGWSSGPVSACVQFYGTNGYVQLQDTPLSDTFTVAFWVDPASEGDGQAFVGKHTGLGSNLFVAGYYDGGYAVYLGPEHYAAGDKTTGWQHLAVVVEKVAEESQVTVYRNGQVLWQETLAASFPSLAGRPWVLGQDWDSDAVTDPLAGCMADVRLYDRALSGEEVLGAMEGIATDADFGTFVLGEIPSKTVWHGNLYSFLFSWEGHDDAAFEVATAGLAGCCGLGIEPVLPGLLPYWKLVYVPAPADKFPFQVTLTGVDGSQRRSQVFEITPIPNLPAEQVVFETTGEGGPGSFIADEVVEEESAGIVEMWNYQPVRPLRKIRITGKTVVFEDTPEADLYDKYNGNLDLEQVEIVAETLVIRSPLHLPQTDVKIRAREVRFEGPDARLITTPIKQIAVPGVSQAGLVGLPAGDVTLEVDGFYTSHGGTKFDLQGGPGQDGGDGQDGTNGASAAEYWRTFQWTDSGIHFSWTAPEGEYIIYQIAYNTCAFGIPIKAFDYPAGGGITPTSGTDAKRSGKPGRGGVGGVLKTSLGEIAAHTNTDAGIPGRTPPQRLGIYKPYYYGGAAGNPRKWRRMKANYCLAAGFSTTSSGETTSGQNAEVVQPDGATAGDYGHVEYPGSATHPWDGSRHAWVEPVLMRRLFAEAKSDYLNGDLAAAQSRMQDLTASIATMQGDAAWTALSEMSRLELMQLHDAMAGLLYQIENNLDYFGNPAGWVPMLSFEVNMGLFDQEIDRAIETLYLTHWITRTSAQQTQKQNALIEMRNHLQEEIDDAYAAYEEGFQSLGSLRTRAQAVRQESDARILDLQALENRLTAQATENTREPWWKTSLKMVGVFCKAVPVYQPVTGFIGEGLTVAMNHDPDDPYATVLASAQLADKAIDTALDDAAAGVGIAASAATGDVGGAVQTALEEMGEAMPSLTDSVTGMVEVLKGIEAPWSEIQAELEKLKAQSPEYQELADKIEELAERQAALARDLSRTMIALAKNANIIRENLQAMDALQEDLASVAIPDPRAVEYVRMLERRALDRLLKYHYYMAKAYEYRVLQPYGEPLNMEEFFHELSNNTAIGGAGNVIPADQFNSLKSLYRESISAVAEKIFTDYNSNPPELSVPIRFSLTADELARLNAGEEVLLNLVDLGIFPPTDENIRIVDFEIFSIATQPVGGDYGLVSYVDLDIEHAGQSLIKSRGQTYQFMHYNQNTDNPIVWGGRYDPGADIIDPIKPSAANDSLLRSLLSGDAVADMMLYSRPSAWADLKISKSHFDNTGIGIDVSSLRLQLTYDFTRRPASLNQAQIQTVISTARVNESGQIQHEEVDFKPYFAVDTPDDNSRQDGRGAFRRTYSKSSQTAVGITPQPRYAQWKFNKWTTRTNQNWASDPVTGSTLFITPSADKTVKAQYVPVDILPADLNDDCIVDVGDVVTLALGWTSLDPILNLNGEDVDGVLDFEDFAVLADNWLRTCEDEIQTMITPPPSMAGVLDTGSSLILPDDPRQIEVVYDSQN